jgi:diguanylate cyclase (GGDEF)-like protein
MYNTDVDVLQEMLESCGIGIVLLDKDSIADINLHGATLFDRAPADMLGNDIHSFLDCPSTLMCKNGDLCDRSRCDAVIGRTKGGTDVSIDLKFKTLSNGTSYAIFHDAGDILKHDSLTNALSRDQFFNRVRKLKANYSLLFIDLNEFKQVNDTHGHQIGDVVLKVTATRIKNVLREGDLFCRYGGDEFIIVVPGGQRISSIVLNKVKEVISKPIATSQSNITISCSIGTARNKEATTIDDLIHIADQRMYKEKIT